MGRSGGLLAWSAAGYLAFFVETVVGVAVSILVVRTLTVAEFGAYKLAGAIILVGGYLTSCGLDATVQRFGTEMIARRHFRTLARFLLYVRLARVLALLAFCGVGLVFKTEIGAFFSFPPALTDALLVVFGILWVQSATGIFGYALFSARHAFLDASALRIAVALLRLGAIGIVFAVGLGLLGVLWALLISGAIGLAYVAVRNQFWLNRQRHQGDADGQDRQGYLDRVVRFSLIGYLAMNVNVFRDLSVDSFVVSHFLGAEQVALYGLASTLFLFANAMNPATLLRSVVTPLLVRRHAESGTVDDLVKGFRLLTKAVMLMHWPLVTLLLVLGHEIIDLVYSANYAAAYAPLAMLCVFAYGLGLTYPFVPLIAVLEKNALLLFAGVVSVYNLVMDIVLVPRFGIAGAAFATGSAAVLQLALYWVAFRFVFAVRLTFPFGMLPRMALNLAVPVALALLLRDHIGSVVELLGLLVLCGLVYGALVWCNHGLDDAERALFGRFGRRATAS